MRTFIHKLYDGDVSVCNRFVACFAWEKRLTYVLCFNFFMGASYRSDKSCICFFFQMSISKMFVYKLSLATV